MTGKRTPRGFDYTGMPRQLATFDAIDRWLSVADLRLHDARAHEQNAADAERLGRHSTAIIERNQAAWCRREHDRAWTRYQRYAALYPRWEARCTMHAGTEPYQHTCAQCLQENNQGQPDHRHGGQHTW